MSKLKGRALTREDKLLPECKKAHPIYEPLLGKYLCWGLIDLLDDEPCDVCRNCKAFWNYDTYRID